MTVQDRYRGALIGLAAGDALGTTVEFQPPGSFQPLTDITGGGPFNLNPGQWTDDTSMALCLAESLVERRGFDPVDQLERYVRWYRQGHLSSTGACFDIGGTTSGSLHRFWADPGSLLRFHKPPGGRQRQHHAPGARAAVLRQLADGLQEVEERIRGMR
jgi:ADP-ribosylglycohydrolase